MITTFFFFCQPSEELGELSEDGGNLENIHYRGVKETFENIHITN
jgi:hypothetical protein